jgi:hypothetical protein
MSFFPEYMTVPISFAERFQPGIVDRIVQGGNRHTWQGPDLVWREARLVGSPDEGYIVEVTTTVPPNENDPEP